MIYQNRLMELKKEKNYTQEDIAKILNISRGQYCHYEAEDEIMPLKYLIVLCKHFKVTLDYIFNFSNCNLYANDNKEIDLVASGKRLKDLRKELGFTQDKFAQKVNVARSMISKYEKGEYLVATHFLYTICKKYNISADYLLGKTDEPKYLK